MTKYKNLTSSGKRQLIERSLEALYKFAFTNNSYDPMIMQLRIQRVLKLIKDGK